MPAARISEEQVLKGGASVLQALHQSPVPSVAEYTALPDMDRTALGAASAYLASDTVVGADQMRSGLGNAVRLACAFALLRQHFDDPAVGGPALRGTLNRKL